MNYNGADYNAFGYDPKGHIAVVAAYFYGPAWQPVHSQPVHSHGIPWLTGCIIGPPRYRPPASWQIPLLPDKSIAYLPPCYIRWPGAYLPGPSTFNTTNFTALFLTLQN